MDSAIVFIDSHVIGYQNLINQLPSGVEWLLLNSEEDGLLQIERALVGRRELDAIHIVSHGYSGGLYLGSAVLDIGTLFSYQNQLQAIGASLGADSEILLYGCNVAAGTSGVEFIDAIALATGADVAASTNATGPLALGGDGVLEYSNGDVTVSKLQVSTLSGLLGTAGIVLTDFGGSERGKSMIVQADGKILVAGTAIINNQYDFALARYNTDGSLDASFSGDGKVTTDLNLGGSDELNSVTVQADGKILVAGNGGKNVGFGVALARYNVDGSLDTSFSGDGKVIGDLDFDHYSLSGFNSVTLQVDGKILVSGSVYVRDYGPKFLLARYNTDGSLDTSFGSYGLLVDFGLSNAQSVTVQADGKILVAGNFDFYSHGALVRYNTDGSLDTSFGYFGKVLTDTGPFPFLYFVTVQADGKILIAGRSDTKVALVRYNTDGSLDTSFGYFGKAISAFGSYPTAISMAVQADGKILVAGTSGNSIDFALARYNTDGSLDASFSGDGKVTTDLGGEDVCYSVTVQADGKILVAGNGGKNDDFALARYNVDGSLDSTFRVNSKPTGNVTISGTAKQGQALTASNTLADADGMGTINYQWLADGTAISRATDYSFTLTQAHVGQSISVQASYTDGQGTAESVASAATGAVANVNDVPTGSVTISGTATQGQKLTASNNLADVDGLGTISYQWLADGTAISGATGSTFTPTQAEVGKAISVKASYTDKLGAVESVNSAPTGKVANVNDVGAVTISGLASQGQTLASLISDADGVPSSGITYQWLADGKTIKGASSSTFTTTQAEVGKAISVKVSYKDSLGAAESVTSSATDKIANANDAPTGSVTISGTATQGQKLTASNNLADVDGLGTISYQWLADGTAISGATGSTFTPTQAEVGKAISVKASYTDKLGAVESVNSAPTGKVANVNDVPTGSVTISGAATQGQKLKASNNLADVDGLGTISYQWLADGTAISGATTSTFTLTQGQVGKAISVKASYTDGQGTAESKKISSATAKVANVNDAATGAVNISGTAAQGQTLTVTNTLADDDGLGTVKYQWLVDGVAIKGATTASLALTQTHVGKAISVKASYTDKLGAVESVNSAPTGKVANVNDAPTGSVTIGGTVTQGQKLTATHKLADVDGLGTVSYQWLADGNAINGATAPTITLGQEQVGKAISVKTSYVDGQGTAESVTSTATAMVASQSKTGTSGGDLLVGGTDKDQLNGLAGNDVIYGGAGNDTLIGGTGADILMGGAGSDVFKFNDLSDLGLGGSARDTIADFKVGEDKIDLKAIDTNGAMKGDQAFTWIDSFTATAGQVRFSTDGQGNGMLYLNTDTDVDAEYEIQLAGVKILTAADIVL